jgi:cytochrome c-type biogenesis protein CcmH/NrfG
MSAEWYYELSETEEALKAISEAESVCPTHPGVWCLLGRIKHSANTEDDNGSDSTTQFFEKGLLLQPGHVDCQIELAKLYMEQQDFCTAEGILESLTRGFGWHSSEAW